MLPSATQIKLLLFPLSTCTYIPQIKSLSESPPPSNNLPHTSNDAKNITPPSAFNPLIPLILLLCHTLRLLGWFLGGDVPLEVAFQSISMLLLMSLMLHTYNLHHSSFSTPVSTFTTQLSSTSSHLQRLLFLLFLLTFILDVLILHPPHLSLLPNIPVITSLALEALPPLVQLHTIKKNNTTNGISPIVPAAWLGGDVSRVLIFMQGGDGMFR
jgi:hypothetical protein